jgi:hypothetical protein
MDTKFVKLNTKDTRDLLNFANKFAYGKNCFYNPIDASGQLSVGIPITCLIGYIDSDNQYHCKIEIKCKKKCKGNVKNQYLIITIGNKNDKNSDVLIHEIKLSAISDINLDNCKQTRIHAKVQIDAIINNDMFDSLIFKVKFKFKNILFSSTYVPMKHLYKKKLIKELEEFRKSLITKENCFLMDSKKHYKLKIVIKKSLLDCIKNVYPDYDYTLSFIGRSCELNSGAYFSFCKLKQIDEMDNIFEINNNCIDCPIGEKYLTSLVIYNADILIVHSNKEYCITKEYNFKNKLDNDVIEIDLVFYSKAYCNLYAQQVIKEEAKELQNDLDIILKGRAKEEEQKRIENKRKEIEKNVARAKKLLDKKEEKEAKEKAYKEAQEKEKEKREKCKEKRKKKKERKKQERKERKKQEQIKKEEEEKVIAEKQTQEKAAKAKQKILEEKAKLITALKSEQERKNKIAIKMAKKAAKKNAIKIQSIFRSFRAKKLLSKLIKNKILEEKQNYNIISQTLDFLILCIEQQDIINKNKIFIHKKHRDSIDFEEKNEFDLEEQQIELEVESDQNYIQEEVKNELIRYECGCWGPANGFCNEECDNQNQIYFQHQQFIPPPHILPPHIHLPYMPVYLQPQIPIYYQFPPYINSEYIDNDFQKQGFNGQPNPPYTPPPPSGNQCISPA